MNTTPKGRSHECELLARLEIQAQALRIVKKEIYENIGQLLVLAKINLSFGDNDIQPIDDKVISPSFLISKAINELRELAKQPTPEQVRKEGFVDSIGHVLQRLEKTGLYSTKFIIEGDRYLLSDSRELIFFCILQDIVLQLVSLEVFHDSILRVDYRPTEISILVLFEASHKHSSPIETYLDNLTKRIPDEFQLVMKTNQALPAIELKIKK
jgi:hypothetical protein